MSDIKFTSDGKKVVVVGKLNAQDTIAQEIFVSGGSEIPSGEHFVVKALHDAPVVSWKEKRIKDIDAEYERKNAEIDRYEKAIREKKKILSATLGSLEKTIRGVSAESFSLLSDVICGNITHVVISNYQSTIKTWDEFMTIGEYSNDCLRLLSVYGQDDGTLTFYQGQYADASGGHNCKFIPCKTLEQAVIELEKVLIAATYWDDGTLERAAKFGIQLPADRIAEYKQKQRDAIEVDIKRLQADVQKKTDALNKYK